MDIKVEIKDSDVKQLLKRLSAKAANAQPAMREIAELVRSSVLKNFMEGGRPQRWKALAASTIRKKRGGAGQILIDSARLRNSIHASSTVTQAIVGTNTRYAAIHQFGGMAGRGGKVRIPARPYLMIQDEDWPGIKDILLRHLMEGV